MKIQLGLPPNIEEIKKYFDVPMNACFPYEGVLYAPLPEKYIDVYLITHEATHMKQQGDDSKGWWDKYLIDKEFRGIQEIEAYHNQFEHYCRNKKNQVKEQIFLNKLAEDLSSPMYGNIFTLEEAKEHIKKSL